MPYCSNCGDSVKDTHRYCGSCGTPLSDEVEEDEGIPPRPSTAYGGGFLSGRSYEYIAKVRGGKEEWDSDSIGYANLKRDVGQAMADFQLLYKIGEANLLALTLEFSSEGNLAREYEKMNHDDKRRMMALWGLFHLPKLYDRVLDTNWEAELGEWLNDMMEELDVEV